MKRDILISFLILCCGPFITVGQELLDTLPQIADPGTNAAVMFSEDNPEAATQAYRDQDYKKSIALYEQIITKGMTEDKVSAQLYYNLGNAYFRDNQLGKAIVCYERALLLDPGDGDIRHNLRFAQTRTIDRIDTADNLFLANWFKGVRNIFSSNQWGIVAIVLFILFLGCTAVYLFVRLLWARKSAFYAGVILLLLMITANTFAFSQKRERTHRDAAIVMVGAATVNASPDTGSNQLFELHEGTKVKIRNNDGNWYEIQIADGSVGWIRQQDVEII
ncbi:tetratricopeptide repeat protein [Proteiniphilum sp. UBA5384]|uniref:tetratricopeptide repeat protein n=1 Tax=Proteiniphilum sp. UBA5384 TaxID=1947279 RepID=UPI0025E00223|nr:tetratricopeptide repeat protein [Proteiniphilum sp. UBA5384]